jgi:hypothetical protein
MTFASGGTAPTDPYLQKLAELLAPDQRRELVRALVLIRDKRGKILLIGREDNAIRFETTVNSEWL